MKTTLQYYFCSLKIKEHSMDVHVMDCDVPNDNGVDMTMYIYDENKDRIGEYLLLNVHDILDVDNKLKELYPDCEITSRYVTYTHSSNIIPRNHYFINIDFVKKEICYKFSLLTKETEYSCPLDVNSLNFDKLHNAWEENAKSIFATLSAQTLEEQQKQKELARELRISD